MLRLYVPFQKVDAETGIVEGFGTVEEVDKQDELVRAVGAQKAFEKWSDAFRKATGGASLGNVREMHQPSAVGKVVYWDARSNDAGKDGIFLSTKVVDDDARRKAVERVYTGFSIGGNPLKSHKEKIGGKRVTVIDEFELVEVSLVDNPACPSATFTVTKIGTPPGDPHVTEVEHADDPAGTDASSGSAPDPKPLKQPNRDSDPSLKPGDPVRTEKDDGDAGMEAIAEPEKEKGGGVKPRADASPKEGEGKYGDVAYADPTNKKYPIDTEEHIRAAWNYINKPANAGKYSAEDVGKIKRRIVAAWKDKIDPKGPPSAKADVAARMRKTLDAVAPALRKQILGPAFHSEIPSLMPALDALRSICAAIDGEMFEMACYGDDERGDVATLTASAEALVDFILGELQEQIRGLTSGEGPIMQEAMKALTHLLDLRKTLTPAQFAKVLSDDDTKTHIKAMHDMGHALTKASYMMGSGCASKDEDLHPTMDGSEPAKGGKEKGADGGEDEKAAVQGKPGPTGATGTKPSVDEPIDDNVKTKPDNDEPGGGGAVPGTTVVGTKPAYGEPEGAPVRAVGAQKGVFEAAFEKVLGEVRGLAESMDKRMRKVEKAPAAIGRPVAAQEKTLPNTGGAGAAADDAAVALAIQKMALEERDPIVREKLLRKSVEISVKNIHSAGKVA